MLNMMSITLPATANRAPLDNTTRQALTTPTFSLQLLVLVAVATALLERTTLC
jgi:hypothetical protein